AITPDPLVAPFAWKGGIYPGTNGTCAATLSAGARCDVVITFAPTATASAGGSLALSYQDESGSGQARAVVALTGMGAASASLVFADAPAFDFGTRPIGSRTDVSFGVVNTGGA